MTVNVELDPIFGRGLFMPKGQIWRQVRTSLTPVFTSGKVKMMFRLVNICGKELADHLDKTIAEGKKL
jgi:cytochrome P450